MYKMLIQKRIMHRLLIVVFMLFCSVAAWAQESYVKGNVKDANGEPIIGATIIENGTSNGTSTDIEGNFSIKVLKPKGLIIVSALGFEAKKVNFSGQQDLNIILKEDAKLLNEVIVVGYGTMKKKDLTGSVASLGSKSLESTPVSDIGKALQGRLSGVQVVDAGTPGSNVTIKIRGLGTINDSDPLIVIDGIPTDLGLSSINMADVDRVDVLKDASATAIYGSRGANGVVMVTTRRGTNGDGKLSVSANVGFQNATNVPEMLNAQQYAQLNNEMLSNAGYTTNPAWIDPSSLTNSTDWLGAMLRTGLKQVYTVSYSGGSEKSQYYVSGGLIDQTGIIESVKYRRFNFKVNNDVQVKDWIKFITSINFSADEKNHGDYSIGSAMRALPTQSIQNADGTWSGPEGNSYWYGSERNPIGVINANRNKTNGYNLLANISGELKFTNWLKFKSTFGYDAKFWFIDNFTPAYNWKPSPVEQSSRYKSDNKSFTYLWDNYFTFDYNFTDKHHLDVMAGSSAQWCTFDYLNAQKNIFMFDNVIEMDNGEKMYSIGGSQNQWSLLSFMARANYSYDNKYLLTATVRRDGSSRFGKNNRWGTFPSVSGAWRLSEENFFKGNEWHINDLKIRAGYGVTGNQNIGNYGFVATYNTSVYPFNGENNTALVSTTLSNPNIHWEEVRQTNIGIDLSMFDTRLNFSVDAYWKNTYDMLVKASIPITSGFEDTTQTYTNAGKVSNKGVEMSLNTVNLKGDLTWETSVSATYNKNKIKDLNSDTPMYINQYNNSYLTMLNAGYPINVFYGYVTDGIFQNQEEVNLHATQSGAEVGDIRFKDLNNDGRITDADRTVIGNPNPNWFFSMNNTFGYKGLELSIFLQGVAGNDIYNANNIDNEGMAAAYNQTTSVLNRWNGEGTSNSMPRAVWGDPNGNTRVSDRFVEDGSYLRIKNITLSYNLPRSIIEKAKINSAKVYVSCANVATFTNYSGFDPEVAINGIDSNRFPISRTYSVGLNLNF